jgi:hypothetical protein
MVVSFKLLKMKLAILFCLISIGFCAASDFPFNGPCPAMFDRLDTKVNVTVWVSYREQLKTIGVQDFAFVKEITIPRNMSKLLAINFPSLGDKFRLSFYEPGTGSNGYYYLEKNPNMDIEHVPQPHMRFNMYTKYFIKDVVEAQIPYFYIDRSVSDITFIPFTDAWCLRLIIPPWMSFGGIEEISIAYDSRKMIDPHEKVFCYEPGNPTLRAMDYFQFQKTQPRGY